LRKNLDNPFRNRCSGSIVRTTYPITELLLRTGVSQLPSDNEKQAATLTSVVESTENSSFTFLNFTMIFLLNHLPDHIRKIKQNLEHWSNKNSAPDKEYENKLSSKP
jgi:hypothetical protein